MQEALTERRSGWPLGTITFAAIASYALYELATDATHAISEMADGADDPDTAEWLRRKPLLDELIFGNNPDPDDEDWVKQMIERAILYGGVTAIAIAKALDMSPQNLHTLRKNGIYKNKATRHGLYAILRKLILRED